jgi:predicted DCC family thiol-disulfide oxidoreductase YuxK
MPADATNPPRLTVYYDGGCPLCRREIDTYRRRPGAEACAWIDASRSDDAALGPGLTREAALARLHVRDASGRLASGARGFAALWQALPGTAWLGRLATAGPMPWLLEGAYRGFLVLRRAWRRPAPAKPRALASTNASVESHLNSDAPAPLQALDRGLETVPDTQVAGASCASAWRAAGWTNRRAAPKRRAEAPAARPPDVAGRPGPGGGHSGHPPRLSARTPAHLLPASKGPT